MKADVTDMKKRVIAISEEARQKLSLLANVMESQEMMSSKMNQFQNWFGEFTNGVSKLV